MARPKKIVEEQTLATNQVGETSATTTPQPSTPPVETISISKSDWDNVQKQLAMLSAVADKGRVFNYESQRAEKKPAKVKLSVFNDCYIVGWKTNKDELVKHPTTGKIVGEAQEYELILLDKNNVQTKVIVNGYPAFSDARYSKRVEAEVVGKREDYNGEVDFDIQLPDGRKISLNSKFIN